MNIKKYYKTYRVLPPDYFYFENADGGENVLNFYLSETLSVAPNFHIYYSLDLVNWIDLGSTYNKSSSNPLSLRYSGKVFLRANTSTWCTYRLRPYYVKIDSQKNVNAGGNIMSLLYGEDFENKTSITSDWTFYSLFKSIGPKLLSINNLKLPATKLAADCYDAMFYGCSALTTAPDLPATILKTKCYTEMFRGCSSLTTAPDLPATTLAESCYDAMFYGCSALTTAPEILPATTLATACYRYMFPNCIFTTAPILPATELVNNCYHFMFSNCPNLNYIKADFLTAPSTSFISGWVTNVSPTGTFVKNPNATWPNTFGTSAIPTGWTVVTE